MDGDPSNNDFFGTLHEYDWRETQMRAGGDTIGMASERSLDYLQSMGIQCVYIAGTHFLNMPWQSDGESSQ
jgi:alpha-1,3-glucan synthase